MGTMTATMTATVTTNTGRPNETLWAIEYARDADGVYHLVHRDGTAYRCDGSPVESVPTDVAWQLGARLPDEEHGAAWGAPIAI